MKRGIGTTIAATRLSDVVDSGGNWKLEGEVALARMNESRSPLRDYETACTRGRRIREQDYRAA